MDDAPLIPWKLWLGVAIIAAVHTGLILIVDSYLQPYEQSRLPAAPTEATAAPSDAAHSRQSAGTTRAAEAPHDTTCDVRPLLSRLRPPQAARYTGSPQGIVANRSSAFVIAGSTSSAPARFLFSVDDGLIAAWSGSVDFTHALVAVDASAGRAVYKGLALSAGGASSLLYAADFRNNRIDVFDARFHRIQTPGGFLDAGLPPGYAPFGVEVIGGDIFVAYALQDGARHDDVKGPGNGFVNVFDPNGRLLRRLVSRGRLNSPWRMALAPPAAGALAGRLLVGNYGDGRINAYDIADGSYVGQLGTRAGASDTSDRGDRSTDDTPPVWAPAVPPRLPDTGVPHPIVPRRARLTWSGIQWRDAAAARAA